ncbi:TorF family putative porin [Marinicella sp. W31]|uniref:TorF family putative porin n=1 Tax=Marinicella sp. W31 TaxID=3023713 RepID=UPI003757E2FE
MNKTLGTLFLLSCTQQLFAQDSTLQTDLTNGTEGWRYSATVSTDDIEHGFSRTLGDPGTQAWIAYRAESGWFTGMRAKTIDFVAIGLPDRDLFISLRGFLGYEWELTESWKTRFSGHLLHFPGANLEDQSYEEVFAEVFYKDLFKFKVDYGIDRYTLTEDSIAYEVSGRYPLTRGYALEGMFGYHDADDLLGDAYSYYSVGINKRFGNFEIGLNYHETSSSGDDLFESISNATGLGLSDLTDPGFVLSFTSHSDIFNQEEWERWPGYKGFSAGVDIVSNYVSKGVSQTEDNPAIQPSIDYAWDNGIYVGLWASNVDYVPRGEPNDGADFEIDYYLGYGWNVLENVSLDISYTFYDYPGIEESIEDDFDYGEWIFGASYNRWGLQVGYSNDQVASGETGTWYKGSADFDLFENLSLNVEAGHYDRSNFGNSYNWWGVDFTYDLGDFSVGLMATQTSSGADLDNTDGQADDHVVFRISYDL